MKIEIKLTKRKMSNENPEIKNYLTNKKIKTKRSKT